MQNLTYKYIHMDNTENKNKETLIRKMLLKYVGKDPDKFTYYASLLHAKGLLNSTSERKIKRVSDTKARQKNKLIAEI